MSSYREYGARSIRWRLGGERFTNLVGGLNLIGSPTELSPAETPDCMNMTLDERGAVVKRLGLNKQSDPFAIVLAPNNVFYSQAVGKLMLQIDASIYKSDNDGSTFTTTALHTFSTNARVGMCDFLGKCIIIHPVDGVFRYDGTTFDIAKVANSPNGTMIVPWKNSLWSAGDPADPTTISSSDVGAITWSSPVRAFNSFRVKDDTPITALSTAGVDSLLVFKEESTYRVQDSISVAYMMISSTHGASSPLAVALNETQCAAICGKGITVTDGLKAPTIVSGKVEPLFRPEQLDFSKRNLWAAGVYRNRFIFSMVKTGGSTNNFTLEYFPGYDAIMPHNFGCVAYTTYTLGDRKLIGANIALSGHPTVFQVFKGGTDDGLPIACTYQTPWTEPAGGLYVRLQRMSLRLRGNCDMQLRKEYESQGSKYSITAPVGGMIWGTGIWGQGKWGTSPYEYSQDLMTGAGVKAISFYFTSSSSSTTTASALLETGSTYEVGDFAIYDVQFDTLLIEVPGV